MLRESGLATGTGYDLAAIVEGEATGGRVRHGEVLVRFVDAALGASNTVLSAAREATRRAVGGAALVDVCATIASFNAVVKVADGTGIPLEAAKELATRDMRESLAIDGFRS